MSSGLTGAVGAGGAGGRWLLDDDKNAAGCSGVVALGADALGDLIEPGGFLD